MVLQKQGLPDGHSRVGSTSALSGREAMYRTPFPRHFLICETDGNTLVASEEPQSDEFPSL